MAKYSIEDSTLSGIADAIREKEGTSDAIPVAELAERISALQGGGGKTYTIQINNYDASFSLWFGNAVMTGLTPSDYPPYIEVTGEGLLVVFVSGSSGYCGGSGCVSQTDGIWLDGGEWYGLMFFFYISGDETTGTLDISPN